jgi:hypothetical protein
MSGGPAKRVLRKVPVSSILDLTIRDWLKAAAPWTKVIVPKYFEAIPLGTAAQ